MAKIDEQPKNRRSATAAKLPRLWGLLTAALGLAGRGKCIENKYFEQNFLKRGEIDRGQCHLSDIASSIRSKVFDRAERGSAFEHQGNENVFPLEQSKQAEISLKLRHLYDGIAGEGLPAELADALGRLECRLRDMGD